MSKKRILIGEDDPSILKMTRVRLEYEGYEVITAVDGDEVLQCAGGDLPIHLILLDIKLPKRDGYDVCRMLKQQPATADIPVIVFTASESQLQRLADRCIEAGATDWVKKPFHTKDLLAKIHRALGAADGGMDG
jgi:CheY-like chemotaxis protein